MSFPRTEMESPRCSSLHGLIGRVSLCWIAGRRAAPALLVASLLAIPLLVAALLAIALLIASLLTITLLVALSSLSLWVALHPHLR